MDCSVIKDLMPLYIEKLTSEPSNSIIREHLKDCEDCKQTLSDLQADIIINNQEVDFHEVENIPNKLIRKIKKNIYEKILIAVIITLVLGIMIGIFRATVFMFIAFLGSISILTFATAIFISIPICRKKASLRKQFKALSNWTFIFSIVICGLCFFLFKWYFDDFTKIFFFLVLEIIYNIILSLTLRIYARFKLPKQDILETGNPLNKKLFKVTFITLILIIVIVTAPVTLLEANRVVDNINLSFVNDSEVLGKWTSVDFVKSPEKFNPDKQLWKGVLFLKGITFLENGELTENFSSSQVNQNLDYPTPWLLWTKDFIMNKGGDHTLCKYTIKEIKGSTYMFLEWKSGDYTYFHATPNYYVLKKESK